MSDERIESAEKKLQLANEVLGFIKGREAALGLNQFELADALNLCRGALLDSRDPQHYLGVGFSS